MRLAAGQWPPAGAAALRQLAMTPTAQTKSDAVGELEWVISVDSTSVRAHQHAAGARKRLARADVKRGSTVTRPRRSAGPGAG